MSFTCTQNMRHGHKDHWKKKSYSDCVECMSWSENEKDRESKRNGAGEDLE